MNFSEEIISICREYLAYLQQEKSCADIIIDYWIPIISAIILVAKKGGILNDKSYRS